MPTFPCKQHSDFHAAAQRRKHLNMLLLDGCEEAIRIRKPAEAVPPPRNHGSPSVAQGAGTEPQPCPRHAQIWTAAYKEGGRAAADLARQVGNKRTPAGQLFGLANPALPNRVHDAASLPNALRESVTKVRMMQRTQRVIATHAATAAGGAMLKLGQGALLTHAALCM
jgi:hypothetical protein